MTRLLLTVAYPRCPECGAVAYPSWATKYRCGCSFTHTHPSDWSTT